MLVGLINVMNVTWYWPNVFFMLTCVGLLVDRVHHDEIGPMPNNHPDLLLHPWWNQDLWAPLGILHSEQLHQKYLYFWIILQSSGSALVWFDESLHYLCNITTPIIFDRVMKHDLVLDSNVGSMLTCLDCCLVVIHWLTNSLMPD